MIGTRTAGASDAMTAVVAQTGLTSLDSTGLSLLLVGILGSLALLTFKIDNPLAYATFGIAVVFTALWAVGTLAIETTMLVYGITGIVLGGVGAFR